MDSELSNISVFIVIINFVIAITIVFKDKREIGTTWAWLLVLFFLPFVGLVLYLLIGKQLKQKNLFKTSSDMRNQCQANADDQIKQLKDGKLICNPLLQKYLKLILMNLNSSKAIVTMKNEIVILSSGEEKFSAFFDDIRAAKREINIQYYIIKRDSLGVKLRDELTKKAKEGVKVRVLYDEIGSRGMSLSFFNELILNGGEVASFFPSYLRFINFRVNNRNHRKLSIIDGEVAYIGGFNLGNEYLGINQKYGFWRDTHLKIKGECINQIQEQFMLDWNLAANRKELSISNQLDNSYGDSPVQVISSGPNSETEHLKNMFIKLIIDAKKSVFIQTPYFIPDTSFMDACKISLLAGVDLRIMIANGNLSPVVYWATRAYVGELLSYGAKVLLYENGFLHAKTIVVDQEVASVGTTNIDIRSFKLNFEVNTIIYDKKVAKQLEDIFIDDSERSAKLTFEKYNQRSLGIKCKESIARLFSPVL